MSASQRPRQRAPTPPYMFSKNAGGDNPDQPASKQHKTRQRSPTPPGRRLRHCNPPMSTRQRPPTPPSKEEAALPKENQQISHEGRPRQRSPSPPSSRMDSFSIGNPSDRDSISTISSSFKRKLSWVYNRLRSPRRPSGSIRTRINGNEEAPSDDNIPHRTPSPPATIGAPPNNDNIPQRTRSPPARRASSLNIENQSIRSDGSAKGRKLKRCLAILLALIASFVVISGVIVVIYYFKNKENNQTDTVADGDQVFSGLLRVNETFSYEMADSSSSKFLSFEERFCSNIESVVTRNVSSGRCKVNSLSKGSIIVNFTLVITHQRSANETLDLLLCLFNGTQVGTMRVDSRATQFTFNPHGNETIVSKELKSSTCSSDSLPISPMNYTYPDYCGDYQVCIKGNSVLQTCPEGQEFAYLLPGDTVICAPPSHNTYCGQKKSETEKTTSRLPSSTSVTDSQQEVKLSTDTSQNALAYATSSSFPSTTTTTTTAMDCPNVLTCSGSYTFIPANDTYPDNCGKYQECVGGKSKVRYCAEGSHFVYSQQNINACHRTDDPITYCNMMTFFKSVCSENSKHFVTTGSLDQVSRVPSFP